MYLSPKEATSLARDSIEVLRPDGRSPFLLLCEHAGAEMPAPWGWLGLDKAYFKTHYAFDLGTADLTRRLSQELDAPAILARYSRILLDYNRAKKDWDRVRPDLGGIPVPGNQNVTAEDLALRESIAARPLRQAMNDLIAGCSGLVSVHSFTPVMDGQQRDVDIAVLWSSRSRLLHAVLRELYARAPAFGFRPGENSPYDCRDFSVDWQGVDQRLPGFYLEINNRLLCDQSVVPRVMRLLQEIFAALVACQADWT